METQDLKSSANKRKYLSFFPNSENKRETKMKVIMNKSLCSIRIVESGVRELPFSEFREN